LTASKRQLWKNEYLQTVIMIVLIVMVVFGFWFGLRLALNTDYPILAVASGSMSTVQPDDGWSHPFSPTLETGDLIIVQGVSPQNIYAASFSKNGSQRSGDILVFRESAGSDDLIVHRAIQEINQSGELLFVTQGDGNSMPGPGSPTPEQNVIGKVIFRIPWIGHLALFMHDSSSLYLILALIIIIILAELVLSIPEDKGTETKKDETAQKT
jgi:signal peptidase